MAQPKREYTALELRLRELRKSVCSRTMNTQVESLLYYHNEQMLVIPDYQRGYVWNAKLKSELIESITLGIPFGAIYLYTIESREFPYITYEIVDGLQRVSTILSFMKNEFRLSDLTLLPEFNGLNYSDLKAQGCAYYFNSCALNLQFLEEGTSIEARKALFNRVNNNLVLMTQEEKDLANNYL